MTLKPVALKALFFAWSFGPFLVAVRHIRDRRYHGIILLFSAVYGYSVFMYSGDILRYAATFDQIREVAWSDYVNQLIAALLWRVGDVEAKFGLLAEQPDIYALSLQFLVSRVTENSRWFFTVVSVVYAWLVLLFVEECTKEIPWSGGLAQKIFFAYLLLLVPFYVGVTGVRFWTALFLFMVFAIRYIRDPRVRHLLGAALAALVHFSFWIPMALLVAYRLVALSRVITWSVLLVAVVFSLATSQAETLGRIQGASILVGETQVADRIETYGDQEILANRMARFEQTNWYVRLNSRLLISLLLGLTTLELTGVVRFKGNAFTDKVFPLFILFFLLTLFTVNLGSIGRFKNVFLLLALIRLAIFSGISGNARPTRIVVVPVAVALVLHVAVSFRAAFYTVDPLLVVGNPAILFMHQSEVSLSQFIVGH